MVMAMKLLTENHEISELEVAIETTRSSSVRPPSDRR